MLMSGFMVFTAYLWHAWIHIIHSTGAEAPAYFHFVPLGQKLQLLFNSNSIGFPLLWLKFDFLSPD
ncbi:MAG: hypothetical protein A2X48_01775 [Lentisphaerae bacterium GWF2_49_21]|nr:MAG: hypothetical protein A2X48_01775 [Lentisphaerae bacterium GWF2_49_21]